MTVWSRCMNVDGYDVALCLGSVEDSGVVSSGGCISMTLLVLMAGSSFANRVATRMSLEWLLGCLTS